MVSFRFILLEVYCLDETCERSPLEHLEWNQGGFCEGHIGDYLHALGLSRMLREYFAVWWEVVCGSLHWHLYRRWTYDDEAFMKWVGERTTEESEEEIERYKCKFPKGE